MTDLLDVLAVIVHDEELHGRAMSAARRHEAVTVADEGDLAAGERTGVHVVDTLFERSLFWQWRTGVARPLLLSQADNLASLDVDLEHIGAAAPGQIVEMSVVNPLSVKRDIRIGDRARSAGNQQFVLAVG